MFSHVLNDSEDTDSSCTCIWSLSTNVWMLWVNQEVVLAFTSDRKTPFSTSTHTYLTSQHKTPHDLQSVNVTPTTTLLFLGRFLRTRQQLSQMCLNLNHLSHHKDQISIWRETLLIRFIGEQTSLINYMITDVSLLSLSLQKICKSQQTVHQINSSCINSLPSSETRHIAQVKVHEISLSNKRGIAQILWDQTTWSSWFKTAHPSQQKLRFYKNVLLTFP